LLHFFRKNTLRQRRSVFSVIHIVENSLAGLGQPQLVAGQVLDELLVILLGQVGLQRLVLLRLLLQLSLQRGLLLRGLVQPLAHPDQLHA